MMSPGFRRASGGHQALRRYRTALPGNGFGRLGISIANIFLVSPRANVAYIALLSKGLRCKPEGYVQSKRSGLLLDRHHPPA
ncbi:MAG: hypothetical protein EBE86_017735 [Hormoscilla sp. GUM202]|nr:hypothetical protein [Hormoscilla sp. GUM202]